MMYSEFCNLLTDDYGCEFQNLPTNEEYALVEFVYTWYPGNLSKYDCCHIWMTNDPMQIFADMLPRARQHDALSNRIRILQSKIKSLNEEIEKLTERNVKLVELDTDTRTDEEDDD